jgi:hypothetical protein
MEMRPGGDGKTPMNSMGDRHDNSSACRPVFRIISLTKKGTHSADQFFTFPQRLHRIDSRFSPASAAHTHFPNSRTSLQRFWEKISDADAQPWRSDPDERVPSGSWWVLRLYGVGSAVPPKQTHFCAAANRRCGSRLCENLVDGMIPLLNRRGKQ